MTGQPETPAGRQEPQEPASADVSQAAGSPASATEVRVFADLHCHSAASFDSLSRPADLIRVARQRGLTHLAITDHERIDGALAARDLAATGVTADAEADLTVIIGEEVRSADGDVIGLFLERAVPPGLSALETIAAIHEQGGLAGIPHPYDRFRASGLAGLPETKLAEVAAVVDYVETWNARVPSAGTNERARVFAEAHGLPGVASSDAHTLTEVGVAWTGLAGPVQSAAELLAALAAARLTTGRASYLVRGLTPVNKVVNRLRGNVRIRPDGVPAR